MNKTLPHFDSYRKLFGAKLHYVEDCCYNFQGSRTSLTNEFLKPFHNVSPRCRHFVHFKKRGVYIALQAFVKKQTALKITSVAR